jgi:YesN/AraC family two-component response regulator
MVREGLKRIIAEAPDLEVAGEADDASGAFKLLRENRWDWWSSTSHCPGRAGWRC